MTEAKKTALFSEHKKLGAKTIDFGDWLMPVSYSSVLEEHKNVREKVGVFDVSHMGEVFIRGKNALSFVNHLTINDASKLKDGSGQYTAMCNEKGGMIDDLIIYRLDAEQFLFCVNASNQEKDFQWIDAKKSLFKDVSVTNESESYSQLAIQGPLSAEAITDLPLSDADKQAITDLAYTHIKKLELFGVPAYIARTGYTGEKGFEIYCSSEVAIKTWQHLIENKHKTGLLPIGLGARDTLRLEACYLLYGNDMDETATPLEVGISWATKLEKEDFIGKRALIEQKQEGVPRKLIAFKLEDPGVARSGMKVFKDGEAIGQVTSGSVLPTVGGAGGLALVKKEAVVINDSIEIEVRGKRKLAKVFKKPLYSAKVKD